MKEKTFLTAEKLRERWGFSSTRQIYRLATAKKIPSLKIGNSWRFPLDLILEYEKTHTSIPEELQQKEEDT